MWQWARVFNAGVWTDGNFRRPFSLEVDVNNRVNVFYRNAVNNTLLSAYGAGGVPENETTVAYGGVLTWLHLGMTWSKSAGANGEVRHYVNGVQEGATDTALGVWAGVLANTRAVIGDSDTGSSRPWHGWLAHPAVFGRPLTPAEVALAYRARWTR